MRGTQAEIERALEGYAVMGLQSCDINDVGIGRVPAGQRSGAPSFRPPTVEAFKRRAALINEYGKTAQRFGMRVQVHNLMVEFDPLPGSNLVGYDILLAETDPALSVLQLDLCWASLSLQDIPALFKKHPGRFELWHVKDVFGIKLASRSLTSDERRVATMQVPVGFGDIDFKTIFSLADLAGLKHFSMEQDNAALWGDSLSAARVGFQNLTTKILA